MAKEKETDEEKAQNAVVRARLKRDAKGDAQEVSKDALAKIRERTKAAEGGNGKPKKKKKKE